MTAPIGGPSSVMQIGAGLVKGFSSFLQAGQVEANAKVLAGDMANRKEAMLAARLANSKREANITSHKIADIESSYSVSGVEMSGDIANYVAKVAAVEEMNNQQLNQNAFYTAAVMDVQRENMQMQAKHKAKALKISAVTSLFGASFEAGEIYSENAAYWESVEKNNTTYWDNYGPGTTMFDLPQSGGFLE